MKVAINTTARTIIDELPDSATEDYKFLVNNGYRLLEVENPYEEDGIGYRALTDEEMKPFLLEEANADFEAQIKVLKEGVPEDEVLTWTEQKQEAKAWTLDGSTPTPLIDGILTARTKYTKAELVAKIIEKANAYSALSGQLIGSRQQSEDSLE